MEVRRAPGSLRRLRDYKVSSANDCNYTVSAPERYSSSSRVTRTRIILIVVWWCGYGLNEYCRRGGAVLCTVDAEVLSTGSILVLCIVDAEVLSVHADESVFGDSFMMFSVSCTVRVECRQYMAREDRPGQ